MDTYKFYYDESEHSRKINYNTVTAPNYYDNFVTVVVGWSKENEKEVCFRCVMCVNDFGGGNRCVSRSK